MVAFNFPDAPTVGQVYGVYSWDGEKWGAVGSGVLPGVGGIPEAPADSKSYGRKNNSWSAVLPVADPAYTGVLSVDATQVLYRADDGTRNYTVIFNGGGVPALICGGAAADKGNYYRNEIHSFQSTDASVTHLAMGAASATFGVMPSGITPAPGDNTLKLATTAFVQGAITAAAPVDPANDGFVYGRKFHAWEKTLPLTGGTVTGEVILPGVNGLRFVQGGYGVMLHNNGTDFYFLMTNAGDPLGGWSSTYPLNFSLSTGNVVIPGHLSVGAAVHAPTVTPSSTSDTRLATTEFVQLALATSSIPGGTTDGHMLRTHGVGTAPTWDGFVQSGSGAVARAWQNKARDTVSIFDFLDQATFVNGSITASGTGTDCSSAASLAYESGAGRRVIFPPGNYRIAGAGLDFIGSMVFDFQPGAVLCPDTGITVTIRNPVVAGMHRIFGDNGAVVGIRRVRPEWFGAANNGSTNDIGALNKAMACVAASGGSVGDMAEIVLSPGGGYYISATWVINTSSNYTIHVRGGGTAGTRIVAAPNISAVSIAGVAAGGVTDLYIHGFQIQASNAVGIGLSVGSSGTQIQGFSQSKIENIDILGFQYGMYIVNCRMVDFKRIGIWMGNVSPGYGIMVQPEANLALNTADCTFETLQIVPWYHDPTEVPTPPPNPDNQYCIFLNSVAGSKGINGLKFLNATLYRPTTAFMQMSANGAYINDLWFYGTHMDGTTSARGVAADAGSGGKVYDVHFSHTYCQGLTGTFFNLDGSGGGSGSISDWNIIGGYCSGGYNQIVAATNARGIVVDGIAARGHVPGSNEMFWFNACRNIVVSNCTIRSYGGETTPYLVTLLGGTDIVSICNNAVDDSISNAIVNNVASGDIKNIYGNGKAVNGVEFLPDNRLMQYSFYPGGGGDVRVNFPVAFKTGTTPIVTANILSGAATNALQTIMIDSVDASGFTARPRYATAGGTVGQATENFNWSAIGLR